MLTAIGLITNRLTLLRIGIILITIEIAPESIRIRLTFLKIY